MSYSTRLLPEYIDLVQNTSIDFYSNSTNILDAIGDYVAELNQSIEFEKSKVTTNQITSLGNLYNALNASNFVVPDFDTSGIETGVKQLDDTFKLLYIEKYQSLSKEYKKIVGDLITSNVYFKNFSDDVGFIADSVTVIDSNTSPYFDINNNLYFNPTNFAATVVSKVSKNEFLISSSFSKYNDALLKRNLQGLQPYTKIRGVSLPVVNKYTAKTAHGTNLVTDILYYDRIFVNQLSILVSLKTILGNLSNFILFFKLLNPKDQDSNRAATFFKYTITNMEGVEKSIDSLKNELVKVEVSTKRVLGVN